MKNAQTERILLVGILLVVLTLVGCTRGYYRRQADREAYNLIRSHATDPRWQLDDYCLEPSPASRMFDPANPDCPPMPPDDPTAHQFMHCVDCKKGSCRWHSYGNTSYVENPYWLAYLPVDAEGTLVLDRQAAMQTALLHSRDYQNSLENLYLSALEVSLQRFRFDVQFFGGNDTFYQAAGRLRNGGVTTNNLTSDTGLEAKRALATGGELVVGLANSMVWEFSGHDHSTTTSLLNFSLLQPLLRGGGRAIALEALTESERALLANVRQMERFRLGFYTEVITGRDAGPGPNVGGLGIGNLAAGGPTSVSGFLGLLQSQVQIRNQRANVSGLQASLARLEAFYEANRLDRFQLDLTRQSVFDAQSRLLSIINSYNDQLDDYKILIGLPPDLDVRIADTLLSKFDLIAPQLTETQEAILDVAHLVGDETVPLPEDYLQRVSSFESRVLAQVELVRQDRAALDRALPERRKNLAQLANREEVRSGQVELAVADVAMLDRRVGRFHQDLVTLEANLQKALDALRAFVQNPPDPSEVAPKAPPAPTSSAPEAPLPPADLTESTPDAPSAAEAGLPPGVQLELPFEPEAPAEPPTPRETLAALLTDLAGHMQALSLIQAATRLDTVTLVPVELAPDKALEIAREHRLDWMNARSALVDQWRQVEIAANALRSDLNLRVEGDIKTVGNNPVRFRSTNGQLRFGVEFDAPLTRLAERNDYRATLIAYQQARRQYYAYEDLVNRGLRRTLRLLHLNQLDFEVRRTATFNAISQVESAQAKLEQPPKTIQTTLSPTTARDLTQALSGLLSAQNNFLGIWVSYEAQRIYLDLDLGTMQLDHSGMWIDPGPITAEHGPTMPPTIPPGALEEIPAGTPVEPAPPAPLPTI